MKTTKFGNIIYPDEYAVSTQIIGVRKDSNSLVESLNKANISTTTKGKRKAKENSHY